MLLPIVILILVFGLGGGGYVGNRAGWGGAQYGGGLVGIILLVLLVYLLLGHGGL